MNGCDVIDRTLPLQFAIADLPRDLLMLREAEPESNGLVMRSAVSWLPSRPFGGAAVFGLRRSFCWAGDGLVVMCVPVRVPADVRSICAAAPSLIPVGKEVPD